MNNALNRVEVVALAFDTIDFINQQRHANNSDS